MSFYSEGNRFSFIVVKRVRCKWIPKTDFTIKFLICRRKIPLQTIPFSKERNIVHGRPRHPQSQGSVERVNADVKEMLATWLSENNSTQWSEGLRFIQFQKNRSYHRVIGLSSSSVPRDLLPDIQTEEDLQAIFEANSVSTDTAISQTEHSTDTETDATMSEMDNITDTNTDGQVTAHNSRQQ